MVFVSPGKWAHRFSLSGLNTDWSIASLTIKEWMIAGSAKHIKSPMTKKQAPHAEIILNLFDFFSKSSFKIDYIICSSLDIDLSF